MLEEVITEYCNAIFSSGADTEEFFYRLELKDGLNLKSTVKSVLEMLSGNILASGELDETSVGFSDRSTGGRKPPIYNLDMILSVGYRVNSKRGIAFRKWANNVLKQFILQGYAINEKRLQALKKTVDIQSRMLADALDIEEKV